MWIGELCEESLRIVDAINAEVDAADAAMVQPHDCLFRSTESAVSRKREEWFVIDFRFNRWSSRGEVSIPLQRASVSARSRMLRQRSRHRPKRRTGEVIAD